MQAWAQAIATNWWIKATSIWPTIGKMPVIEMNSRLTSCGGRAFMLTPKNKLNFPDLIEKIDFSCYLMEKDYAEYQREIIPHELAHFIAFRVYGEQNHGKAFVDVMQQLGCRGTRWHSIETKSMAERKAK